jgi:hypothetical protein
VPSDRIEERRHVGAGLVDRLGRPAVAPRGVDDREVEAFIAGVERDEQVEHLIDDGIGSGVGPITLVDHDDERMVEFERLAEHEAGLGHGTLEGIDEQQHAVRHLEHALDLPPEVGVSRRVDQVDAERLARMLAVDRPVGDGAVLREDGDAPLPLEGIGVEHTGVGIVALGERAAAFEQAVDERGLAVIDVGDDGDVAEVGIGGVQHGPGMIAIRGGRHAAWSARPSSDTATHVVAVRGESVCVRSRFVASPTVLGNSASRGAPFGVS